MQNALWFQASRSSLLRTSIRRMSSSAASDGSSKVFPSRAEIEKAVFASYSRRASFPLFRGEGGVIEGNKIFITEASPSKASVEKMLSSSHINQMMHTPLARSSQEAKDMPPLVADAIRKGFIGKRFKQMQVSQAGEPSVIELDGTIYIVKQE
jgi:hypothetical protein